MNRIEFNDEKSYLSTVRALMKAGAAFNAEKVGAIFVIETSTSALQAPAQAGKAPAGKAPAQADKAPAGRQAGAGAGAALGKFALGSLRLLWLVAKVVLFIAFLPFTLLLPFAIGVSQGVSAGDGRE